MQAVNGWGCPAPLDLQPAPLNLPLAPLDPMSSNDRIGEITIIKQCEQGI
jgi:hypothetical protein